MTREEFMYIVQMDQEQLENIMLLSGEDEPEDGNWTEMMKKWYEGARQYICTLENRHHS